MHQGVILKVTSDQDRALARQWRPTSSGVCQAARLQQATISRRTRPCTISTITTSAVTLSQLHSCDCLFAETRLPLTSHVSFPRPYYYPEPRTSGPPLLLCRKLNPTASSTRSVKDRQQTLQPAQVTIESGRVLC